MYAMHVSNAFGHIPQIPRHHTTNLSHAKAPHIWVSSYDLCDVQCVRCVCLTTQTTDCLYTNALWIGNKTHHHKNGTKNKMDGLGQTCARWLRKTHHTIFSNKWLKRHTFYTSYSMYSGSCTAKTHVTDSFRMQCNNFPLKTMHSRSRSASTEKHHLYCWLLGRSDSIQHDDDQLFINMMTDAIASLLLLAYAIHHTQNLHWSHGTAR